MLCNQIQIWQAVLWEQPKKICLFEFYYAGEMQANDYDGKADKQDEVWEKY